MRHGEDVELAHVEAECIAETDKAILCLLETGEKIWVPKSLVQDDSEVWKKGDEGELSVPWWFAEKEGVV